MLLAVPIAGVIQVFVVKWATNKENKLSIQKEPKEPSETE